MENIDTLLNIQANESADSLIERTPQAIMPKLKLDKRFQGSADQYDHQIEFESVVSSKKATLYRDHLYENNLSHNLSKEVSLNQLPQDLNRYGHDRQSMIEASSVSKSSIILQDSIMLESTLNQHRDHRPVSKQPLLPHQSSQFTQIETLEGSSHILSQRRVLLKDTIMATAQQSLQQNLNGNHLQSLQNPVNMSIFSNAVNQNSGFFDKKVSLQKRAVEIKIQDIGLPNQDTKTRNFKNKTTM